MIKRFVILGMLSIIYFSSCAAFAGDEKPSYIQNKLTGNWNGYRDKFAEAGVTFDLYYKLDAWRNFSGGVKTGNQMLDNLDVKMTVDGEKAADLSGTTFFLYLLNNNGGKPNRLVGSNGGITNIEVPVRSPKIYEAWVQKEFRDGTISVLAGLHDLNSEFYVTNTSGIFLNPTYGIGTEASATGDMGPSIFPYTSAALRICLHTTKNVYLMGAVFDGVPSNPNHPRGTHVNFGNKNGALLIAEGGIQDDNIGHFAAGFWDYTAKRPDLVTPAIGQNSHGGYFLADKSVYKDNEKEISVFGRLGLTAGDVEHFESSWSAGAVFNGFVPSRHDGQIGVAISQNTNSDKYMTANTPLKRSETQVELTYKDKILPWMNIQPDIQYTQNPGTSPTAKNAFTAGIRFGIDL